MAFKVKGVRRISHGNQAAVTNAPPRSIAVQGILPASIRQKQANRTRVSRKYEDWTRDDSPPFSWQVDEPASPRPALKKMAVLGATGVIVTGIRFCR